MNATQIQSAVDACVGSHSTYASAEHLLDELVIESGEMPLPDEWQAAASRYAAAVKADWLERGWLHVDCRHEDCEARLGEVQEIADWALPGEAEAAIAAE